MNSHVGPVEHVVAGDGVSIAYQGIGQGPPVLVIPTIGFPLRLEEEAMSSARLGAKLHNSCTFVSWEQRGIGLSDQTPTDFSVNAWVQDATAVAEALGPPVPVFARAFSGPVAVTLAAKRPDLVSELVLVDTGACAEELLQIDGFRGWFQPVDATPGLERRRFDDAGDPSVLLKRDYGAAWPRTTPVLQCARPRFWSGVTERVRGGAARPFVRAGLDWLRMVVT